MKYLLDTHTMIWAVADTGKLSPAVREILENPHHQIFVSSICFWEISLKYSLGKLDLKNIAPEDFPTACIAMDFDILPLDAQPAASFYLLKAKSHKDPFDRMLLWQALSLDLPLVSKDPEIALYKSEGLKVIW